MAQATLCATSRDRAPELPQGPKMKVASPDCRRRLSVKRHRRVECDTDLVLDYPYWIVGLRSVHSYHVSDQIDIVFQNHV